MVAPCRQKAGGRGLRRRDRHAADPRRGPLTGTGHTARRTACVRSRIMTPHRRQASAPRHREARGRETAAARHGVRRSGAHPAARPDARPHREHATRQRQVAAGPAKASRGSGPCAAQLQINPHGPRSGSMSVHLTPRQGSGRGLSIHQRPGHDLNATPTVTADSIRPMPQPPPGPPSFSVAASRGRLAGGNCGSGNGHTIQARLGAASTSRKCNALNASFARRDKYSSAWRASHTDHTLRAGNTLQ